MKEEYKMCPNCHNMVDKKDKECPYCLESLIRRDFSVVKESNSKKSTNNNSIKKENSGNPSLLDILIENRKDIGWGNKKEIENKIINKARKIFIIFWIMVIILPFIIEIIKLIFGD